MHIRHSAIKLLAKNLALITTILLATAAVLRAQTTTSMMLTGVGDGATFGDVYVDPYTATVGGVANTTVICDDWSNNSYLGESWTATITNAANVASGAPMFGNNSQGQALYNEVAWLGAQLLADPTNTTEQTEISFAMWDLTYGQNNTTEETTSPLQYLSENLAGGTSNSEYIATTNLISTAQSSESNYNSAGWQILTPIPGTQSPGSDGTPQEFLVYTPEPSQAAILGADLLLFVAAVFILRRRGLLATRRWQL